ncbi:MAG: hypothetical protein KDD73_05270 [Anaerolineales bacterium]|nr:hypothetical protein [Anaerolineales bacterium]MCB9126718.1 hypothetical protein [Ardenticatenales bacterium]MCB9171740.1 hypothetical protein [Ardenticatenales bacterium]
MTAIAKHPTLDLFARLLFPVGLLLTHLLRLGGSDGVASLVMLIAASGVTLLGLSLALRLYPRAPQWATAAGALLLVTPLIGAGSWEYLSLVDARLGSAAATTFAALPLYTIVAPLFGVATVAALAALSVGLQRASAQSTGLTALQLLALLLFFVSWFVQPVLLGLLAALLLTVGYGMAGRSGVAARAEPIAA